jgi:hypothetical protein
MKDYSVDPTYKILRQPESLKIDDPIFAYLNAPEYCFIHSEWDGKSETVKVKLLNEDIVDAPVHELFAILIDSRHLTHLHFNHSSGEFSPCYSLGGVAIAPVFKHDHTQIFTGLRFINDIGTFEEDCREMTSRELIEKYPSVEALHVLQDKFDNSNPEKTKFMQNVLELMKKMQGS